MKFVLACTFSVLGAAASVMPAYAQSNAPITPTPPAVAVTVDNYIRAESDRSLESVVRRGGFGKFFNQRELAPINRQIVVRPNRDTLYSLGVVDLDAGPVTITMPDAGKRFMSLQVIDEDHYTHADIYGAGTYTFTRERIGTRYALLAVRTLLDPADPKDVKQAHALQDALKLTQKHPGSFEIPNWDQAELTKLREALLVLGTTVQDTRGMFGSPRQVDPVRRLIGTALAWGGSPEKDAYYLPITPAKNDGATIYKLSVGEVPVDGFWSVSVYNAKGLFEPNKFGWYSLNNITAKKNPDGKVEIQFGGCDAATAVNCLPTMPGWNYLVRLYRARPDVLSGKWTFPQAQAVD